MRPDSAQALRWDEATANTRCRGAPERVIVDHVLAISVIAALPSSERAAASRRIRELMTTYPALRGCDTVRSPVSNTRRRLPDGRNRHFGRTRAD
jgi:hypothetical protein